MGGVVERPRASGRLAEGAHVPDRLEKGNRGAVDVTLGGESAEAHT